MADTDRDDQLLAPYWAAARRDDAVQPSPDWMARVLADAERVQPVPGVAAPDPFWSQIFSTFGGWPGLGGMVAASAAGLWLGFAPVSFLSDPLAAVIGVDISYDLMPVNNLDFTASFEEG
jgi:hypothetical protein